MNVEQKKTILSLQDGWNCGIHDFIRLSRITLPLNQYSMQQLFHDMKLYSLGFFGLNYRNESVVNALRLI